MKISQENKSTATVNNEVILPCWLLDLSYTTEMILTLSGFDIDIASFYMGLLSYNKWTRMSGVWSSWNKFDLWEKSSYCLNSTIFTLLNYTPFIQVPSTMDARSLHHVMFGLHPGVDQGSGIVTLTIWLALTSLCNKQNSGKSFQKSCEVLTGLGDRMTVCRLRYNK
jgi:hypothetical protein